MLRPDYQRSIVNLMASLARGLGAPDTGYAPLQEMANLELTGRPVVLLVIDGLGDEFLARYPDSHLARHRVGRLTSVFPTTTAAAVTTFGTAVAPQQHGITGWFMLLRELGSIAAVLPFRPRFGGVPYSEFGVSPARYIAAAPMSRNIRVPATYVSPSYIVDSPFNRSLGGPATRRGYDGLAEFFGTLESEVGKEAGYVYGYWAEFDAICHRHGAQSSEAVRHFHELDAGFGAFLHAVGGRGALVIATADHGHIDADERQAVDFQAHPELAETLLLPLCGDPRAAFCYVRHGRHKAFRNYVESELHGYCELVRSGDLVADGFFGNGEPTPELHTRVGDFTLIAKAHATFRDRLPTEKDFRLASVHGGLSPQELYVPLLVAET